MSRVSNNQRSESSGFYYDGSNNPFAEPSYGDRSKDGPARDGGEKPRMVWDEVDECYVEDRRRHYPCDDDD